MQPDITRNTARDTSGYTRTVLDSVPVRYGAAQPSLRRGSLRPHPLKDGVINTGAHLEYGLTRDRNGNRLVAVMDPITGFCVGVRSNLMSVPNNCAGQPVKPGIAGSITRDTEVCLVQRDLAGTYFTVSSDGEEVRAVRTTEMGDFLLPTVRMSVPTKTVKERAVRDPSAPKRRVPGATGPGGRISDADCDAMIAAMAKGRPVNITPLMRKAARALIQQRMAEAAKLLAAREGLADPTE